MEPILIYGFPLGSSMGLVAALEWLGEPYRLCRVDMLGEMREPSYARINPRHETPVFVDDQGRILTETVAIASWLEARDTHRRVSFDPLSRKADRMHQIGLCEYRLHGGIHASLGRARNGSAEPRSAGYASGLGQGEDPRASRQAGGNDLRHALPGWR